VKFEAFFVDSDVLIDYLNNQTPAINFLKEHPELQVPCFCLMELLVGCRNKPEQVALFKRLEMFPIHYPGDEALRLARDILEKHRLSKGVGLVDALIAGTTIAAGAKLYTRNSKHFKGLGVAYETPYSGSTAPEN